MTDPTERPDRRPAPARLLAGLVLGGVAAASAAWLALARPGASGRAAAAAPAGFADPALGRRLLERYQCGSCHVIPEVPAAQGRAGPPLERFGRLSYIAGQVPNRPDLLAQWIVAPASLVPGTAMPAMGVSPAHARHMAAYLAALR